MGLALGPQHISIIGTRDGESREFYVVMDSWQNLLGLKWSNVEKTVYLYFRIAQKDLLIYRRTRSIQSTQKKDRKKKFVLSKSVKKYLKREKRTFLIETIKDLFRIIHVEKGKVQGQVGFSNPASTGLLMGFIAGLKPLIGRHIIIDIIPNFTSKQLGGSVSLSANFVMLHFLWYIIRTVFRWRALNKSLDFKKGIEDGY